MAIITKSSAVAKARRAVAGLLHELRLKAQQDLTEVLLPAGVPALVRSLPCSTIGEKNHADRTACFIAGINLRTYLRKSYRSGAEIPFGRTERRQQLGGNYQSVLDCVGQAELDVITQNDHYSNFDGDQFTKALRLNDQFRTGEFEAHQLHRPRTAGISVELDDSDVEGIWLASKLSSARFLEVPLGLPPWAQLGVHRMQTGRHHFSSDDNGRRYSNAVGFPGWLRRLLTFEGQSVREWDISNSHPVVLSMLAEEMGFDLSRLRQDSTRGHFYEALEELAISRGITREQLVITPRHRPGVAIDPPAETMRGVLKDGVMRALNDHLRYLASNPVVPLLSDLYGDDFERIIRHVHAQGRNSLPNMLMRRESELLVYGPNSVVHRLMQVDFDMPLLTIHDSFVAPPKYEQLILEAIAAAYGDFAPHVKVKG